MLHRESQHLNLQEVSLTEYQMIAKSHVWRKVLEANWKVQREALCRAKRLSIRWVMAAKMVLSER